MAEKIKLVQGDTKPYIVVSLTDESTGDPIDVSSGVTALKFRATGSDTILFSVPGIKIAGKLNADGTVTSTGTYATPGKGGRVQFAWRDGDLNQSAGDYEGEIEITYSDGSIQTVYDLLKFKIRGDF